MDYRVKLNQFEGPLDLLLHLILKAELDICDIYVSEITSQYLEYMTQIDALDMDTASEFLAVAAQLVFMKSKTLLPGKNNEVEQKEPDECDLIERLTEYKRMKELSISLGTLYEEARKSFSKPMEEFVPTAPEIVWQQTSPDALFKAFLSALCRVRGDHEKKEYVHSIEGDEYTISDRVIFLRDIVKKRKTIGFFELFCENCSRMAIIVTFMAMLEMAARGELSISQEAPYTPIMISYKGAPNKESQYAEHYKYDEEGVL
ncbi:MAG: segregation/condensation protein A [Clostridia bacterium]|nr:segregation/condensation protein A [Clostridia bacterium]